MTQIRTHVLQCTNCQSEFLHSIGSGVMRNSYTRQFFTDGFFGTSDYKCYAEKLVVCPECADVLWHENLDCRQITSIDTKLPYVGQYECDDRFVNLYKNSFWKNNAQEIYIRRLVWWIDNKPYRIDQDNAGLFSKEQKNNLNILAYLIPSDGYTLILERAEILRELCRFEDSVNELGYLLSGHKLNDEEMILLAQSIKELANNGEYRVRLITPKKFEKQIRHIKTCRESVIINIKRILGVMSNQEEAGLVIQGIMKRIDHDKYTTAFGIDYYQVAEYVLKVLKYRESAKLIIEENIRLLSAGDNRFVFTMKFHADHFSDREYIKKTLKEKDCLLPPVVLKMLGL